MHQKSSSKGFNLSELLVAMGLIGMLAITMLSLNNFNNNKIQIAQTKLAQVDSSIKAWGKAVTRANETGLGVSSRINDVNALETSLKGSLNVKSSQINGDVVNIVLDNDVKLTATFLNQRSVLDSKLFPEAILNKSISPVALIVADAGIDKVSTEDYVLAQTEITTTDELFEGYEKKDIQTVSGSDGQPDKTYICLDDSLCGLNVENTETGKSGCEGNPSACIEVDIQCEASNNVYIKKDAKTLACGENQTGSQNEVTVATLCGMSTFFQKTCCPSPTVYSATAGKCVCSKNEIAFNKGEVFNGQSVEFDADGKYDNTDNLTCKKPAEPGQYADNNHDAILCGTGTYDTKKGYYCNQYSMSTSELCPKGYYCPRTISEVIVSGNVQTTTDKKNLFHEDKFKNDDGTDIQAESNYKIGGLINKLKCPPGYYCPNEGMTTPKPCTAGHYCPEGSTDEIPCPEGTYNGQEKQTACISCPDGQYQDQKGQTECKACTSGVVNESKTACIGCKAGEQMNSQTHQCEPCPAGTYNDKANGTCRTCESGTISTGGAKICATCTCNKYQDGDNHTVCKDIPAGWHTKDNYGPDVPLTQDMVEPCPVGHYCTPTPQSCGGTIDECKPGTVQPKTGQTSCNACEPGTVQPKSGQTSCNACEPGTVQPKSGQTACTNCNSGQYQDETGKTSCKTCGTGTFSPTTGAVAACTDCNSGQYQDETGKTSCKTCDAGTYSPTTGAVAACTDCNSGKYQDVAGQSSCKTCSAGTYSPTTGKITACTNCNSGKYQDVAGQSSCKTCSAGTYSPTTGAITACTNCNSGQYQDETGKTSCKTCDAGTYSPTTGAVAACTNCNSGKYQDLAGQSSCKTCSAGTYSPATGKITACTNCNSGKYQDLAGQSSCETCEPGTYSPTTGAVQYCTKCDVGQYQNEAGKTSCKNCGCGEYNPYEGQASCSKCPSGTYYPESSTPAIVKTDCRLPDDGYYVSEGEGQCIQKSICPAYTKFHVLRQSSINVSLGCSISMFVTGKAGSWTTSAGNRNSGAGWENSNGSSTNGCFNAQRAIPQELKNVVAKLPAADQARTFDIGTGHFAYVIAEKADGSAEIAGMFSQRAWCMMVPDDDDAYNNCAKFRSPSYDTCEKRCNTGNAQVQQECINSCEHFSYSSSAGSMFNSCKNISPWAECREECTGGQLKYDENCTYAVGVSVFRDASPLILDLKGDGYKFTTVKDGVEFDLDGNGEVDRTAWTDYQSEFDDAFLVYDKNENGQVDSGKELFGDQSGAATGFDELAKYDTNGDGVITKEDEIFPKLQLWCDMNKNGKVDYDEDGNTEEMKSLDDMKITEISTSYAMNLGDNNKIATDEYGNKVGFVGWFKQLVEEIVDGILTLVEKVKTMIDVFFLMA